jgi:hypothetical protein
LVVLGSRFGVVCLVVGSMLRFTVWGVMGVCLCCRVFGCVWRHLWATERVTGIQSFWLVVGIALLLFRLCLALSHHWCPALPV